MNFPKISYSLLAGTVSATGSVCGKLASVVQFESSEVLLSDLLNYVITIAFLILMVLCNVTGWILFTRAMHQLNSSLMATLITSTTNYIFSGVFGWLLFHESLSVFWFLGVICVCLGLLLITADHGEETNKKNHAD